jgi:hypothetical protein
LAKNPKQSFSETCNACHRSPRELKPTSPGFMREHYTTGPREAAAMAAYLSSIGSDPSAVRQRKPPTLGAGTSAPAETATARPPQPVPAGAAPDQAGPNENGKPAENQAALPSGRREKPAAGEKPGANEKSAAAEKPSAAAAVAAGRPRRPSESMETGRLTASSTGGAEAPAQAVAAPAARPSPPEEFEE